MNPAQIIIKKRNREELTQAEIHYFISSFVKDKVEDYQMSAMLMAILLNGMSENEIYSLTKEYIDSGITLTFPESQGRCIDKHSTGGVGDKLSLMIGPLAAECGVMVPMISGRGLGHTGGTLDKLESIPGFQTQISLDRFQKIVRENNFAIIGQSDKIVPADRRIYALRDVTGTVESIPLITASIMSKKIASGVDGLVIDLKVGNGAFIGTVEHAEQLARIMSKIAKDFSKKIIINFTDMNEPLGRYIGNAVEVIEAIEFLKGNMEPDLKEVTFQLVADMLILAGVSENFNEVDIIIDQAIDSGRALERFRKGIELQHGNPEVIDDYSLFPQPKYKIAIYAKQTGYIKNINSKVIGYALIDVKAGRKQLDDTIDHAAGLKLLKKVGDEVTKGESIAELFYDNDHGNKAAKEIENCFEYSEDKITRTSRLLGSYK
ncbi:MAG TPA: thymidine phosphorylase [Candidatus Cloacimonetes bacterium]|nr:thymidine phosphorylase [Candidatus Cloacimonadota bacterium]